MRNNIQNDVKIERAKLPLSKFNLSGSVSTTCKIGEVGVSFSRLLQPYTKAMCSQEQLIRMNPLVSPVYAKQFYKTWHMFVPIEDVWANYSAFVTKTPISRNGVVFTPSKEPFMNVGQFTAFCLNGAKCSIYYKHVPAGSSATVNGIFHIASYEDNPNVVTATQLDNPIKYRTLIDQALYNVYGSRSDTAPTLNILALTGIQFANTLYLESGNIDRKSFTMVDSSDIDDEVTGYDVTNVVAIDKADNVVFKTIDVSGQTFVIAYAFRYSSWGQHYLSVLRGLGYPVDLDSSKQRSVLPLLAVYKCYWDVFGLNMWQNFESTYCGRLKTYLENKADGTVASDPTACELFVNFVYDELGSMWVTEQNDYISAHLPQPVISVDNKTPLFGVVDVMDASGSETGPARTVAVLDRSDAVNGQPNVISKDGHASTKTQFHGHLDSEILKRLYKATNRNTALGKKIADLMRAQGLGQYMERTRVNYIGDTCVPIDITSVTSTADTFDATTKQGTLLGQYGGKGVGYQDNKDKKLWYKTDCLGWWICLDAMTCDAGYSQGEDLTLAAIEQEQQYQPDYDGLGLTLHPMSIINGSRDVCLGSLRSGSYPVESLTDKPYGFAPRYSEFKVGRNTLNKGFALKSLRDYFLTYNMDKLIFPDDIVSWDVTDKVNTTPTGGKSYKVERMLPPADIPTAGNPWRFLGRFPWLVNFQRIFAAVSQSMPYSMFGGGALSALAKYFEYHYLTDDNYIVLQEIWFKAWSPMLPQEETYGTIDPDRKSLEYIDRV